MRTRIFGICVLLLGLTLVACRAGSTGQIAPTNTTNPATETPLAQTSGQSAIDLNVELPAGDPLAGELSSLSYRCFGCHVGGGESHPEGPRFTSSDELPRIMERGEIRIADITYAGQATTNHAYIIESIMLPDVYLAPGEWPEANSMPTDYHERLSDQDLADIIAWMNTFE